MTSWAVAASDEVAQEFAERAALDGASALQCALSGYFAAAGAHPGVLLGPLTVLLFGFGARRVFDGRVRQPGLGAKRPRGFTTGQEVAEAARVGVMCSPIAAFVALSYDTQSSRSQVTKAGESLAKKAGAPRRAQLLAALSRLGASAFTTELIRPVLREAGLAEGGLVTAQDFARVPAVDQPCSISQAPSGTRLGVPWLGPSDPQQSVCTLDARGNAVCLCYERSEDGLPIADWDLLAPPRAVPVMRGVPRVTPGEPLPAPARLAIELDDSGRLRAASADWSDDDLTTAAVRVLRPSVS